MPLQAPPKSSNDDNGMILSRLLEPLVETNEAKVAERMGESLEREPVLLLLLPVVPCQ